jgi:CubicO group peptidase (beta-lactamase class C family)
VPGSDWQRVDPASAGMDADKLQAALDYGSANAGFAVRVYRYGCLVGADRLEAVNDDQTSESYSMSKSVASLLFGRAMTLGLISPDDPVGSLVPEADRAHGKITMRDLLTMSSGLRWNGFRDYNIFTMPDRVRDALTLPVVHRAGTYFEYAQSPVALLVKAVERAVGEDPEVFLQRELLDHIGIPAGTWNWQRDPAGNIQGFYGARMRPNDFARLGELLRRGGVWNGHRLLSRDYLRQALAPSETNGCYGWFIWLNAGAPCIGPTIASRPVEQDRDFPSLPADMYNFSGLFGQRVTVFPSQDLMIVRLGQDPGLVFSADEGWELGLYRRVLAAITDEKVPVPKPAKPTRDEQEADYGFQNALFEPDQYSKGGQQDPLPPAGPVRARALELEQIASRSTHNGGIRVRVRLSCPPGWPAPGADTCVGVARIAGAARSESGARVSYSLAAGRSKTVGFEIPAGADRPVTVIATNRAPGGGTRSELEIRPSARP